MKSLWELTGPKISVEAAVPGKSADTVVVGAGLTGLATAVLLARSGQRVTVLEARHIGAVTTGNTTGKLSLLQGSVLGDLRQHAGDEVLQAYVTGNLEGQAWLVRELQNAGIQPQQRPAYTYTLNGEGMETLEAEMSAAHLAGLPARWSGELELPFCVFSSIWLGDQYQLHPMEVLKMLGEELLRRGGTIVENCRVTDVSTDNGGVTVRSERGEVKALHCVLATGTPILDRSTFFARLEPSRSFVCAYRLAHRAVPDGMYVSVGGAGKSLRQAQGPDGEDVLLVGGGVHVTGRDRDTSETLDEITSWTHEHFGPAQRVTWWAAQDYQTHSRVPFAGPIPNGNDRIFAATGYNKWGMTNAIAAALTLSARILGGNLEWADTMAQAGPSLRDLGSTIKANAQVAGYLAGGWLRAEFESAAALQDLDDGQGTVVSDGFTPVAVSKQDNELCRLSAVCTHLGGIVTWNEAENSWDCPLHGSRFDAEGQVLEGPAVEPLKPVNA